MRLLKELFSKDGLKLTGKTIARKAVRGIILDDRKLLMIYSYKNGDEVVASNLSAIAAYGFSAGY